MISKNQIKLIRSLEMKKNRKSEQLFVAEGPKVVGDLLQAGFLPHSIFCIDECSIPNTHHLTPIVLSLPCWQEAENRRSKVICLL